jgi:serine/threonine protein phosphatase PrpC
VLSEPEIRITTLNPSTDDFLVLASDGLFDRFSSSECVDFATKHFLKQGGLTEQDPQHVAHKLVKEATGQRVNSDNTTVLVIALNNGFEVRTEPI